MDQVKMVKKVGNSNRIAVFWKICREGPCSRTEIAVSTGLSIMTVKKIVDVLIERRIVEENKLNTSVGRKPGLLTVAHEQGNIVCIDLSSPLLGRAVCYTVKQEEIGRYQVDFSREYSYEARLRELVSQIREDIPDIIGVGLSLAGAYDPDTDSAPHDLVRPYEGIRFKELLQETFGIKNIFIGHDVHVAAGYEAGVRCTESLLYLYFGAGVGSSLIERDNTVLGCSRTAGEIGKCIVAEDGTTLQKRASLMRLLVKGGYASFADLKKKAAEGEEKAAKLISQAIMAINHTIYNMIYIINPRYIVIDSSDRDYALFIKEEAEAYCNGIMKDSDLPAAFTIEVSGAVDQGNITYSLHHQLMEEYIVSAFE